MREATNAAARCQPVRKRSISPVLSFRGWLFPVLLGIFFTFGNYAAQQSRLPVKTPRFWLTAVFFVLLFLLLFSVAYRWMGIHAVQPPDSSYSVRNAARAWWKFEYWLSTASVVRDVVRLLICWSPVAFMVYPGIRGADTGDMIAMYLGYPALTQPAGTIWLHHPWFDTVIYGFAAQTSMNLTGSADLGLFAVCLVQAVVAACGFVVIFAWLSSKSVSRKILTAVTLFVAFFPIVPYVAFNINKDMTYACFLVLYCALLFIVLDDAHQNLLRNSAFDCLFLLVAVITSLCVRSGVIVIAGTSVLLACVTRSWRRRLLAVMSAIMIVLVSNVVAPLAVYPRIHAVKAIPGRHLWRQPP